jgi:hypothetical protein
MSSSISRFGRAVVGIFLATAFALSLGLGSAIAEAREPDHAAHASLTAESSSSAVVVDSGTGPIEATGGRETIYAYDFCTDACCAKPRGDLSGRSFHLVLHDQQVPVGCPVLDADTPTTPVSRSVATEAAPPGLSGATRTGSALRTDAQHAFPDVVDNFATSGSKFSIPTKGPGGSVVRNRICIRSRAV